MTTAFLWLRRLWVTLAVLADRDAMADLRAARADPTPVCWCCGGDITRRRGDPWEGRMDEYCDDCAWARCDAYPDRCPLRYPHPAQAAADGQRASEPARPNEYADRPKPRMTSDPLHGPHPFYDTAAAAPGSPTQGSSERSHPLWAALDSTEPLERDALLAEYGYVLSGSGSPTLRKAARLVPELRLRFRTSPAHPVHCLLDAVEALAVAGGGSGPREMTEDEYVEFIRSGHRPENTRVPDVATHAAAVRRLVTEGVLDESHLRLLAGGGSEPEPGTCECGAPPNAMHYAGCFFLPDGDPGAPAGPPIYPPGYAAAGGSGEPEREARG